MCLHHTHFWQRYPWGLSLRDGRRILYDCGRPVEIVAEYEESDSFYSVFQTSSRTQAPSTFAIDLTQSWTNQTVVAKTQTIQPDDMRLLRQPMLYYDKPNGVVRRYGGWSYEPVDFDTQTWSFKAGSIEVDWVNDTVGDADPATRDFLPILRARSQRRMPSPTRRSSLMVEIS